MIPQAQGINSIEGLFQGREKRLEAMPQRAREQFTRLVESNADDREYGDRLLVTQWMSAKTKRAPAEVLANYGAYSEAFFGKDVSAAKAYDRIVEDYRALREIEAAEVRAITGTTTAYNVSQSVKSVVSGMASFGHMGVAGALSQAASALSWVSEAAAKEEERSAERWGKRPQGQLSFPEEAAKLAAKARAGSEFFYELSRANNEYYGVDDEFSQTPLGTVSYAAGSLPASLGTVAVGTMLGGPAGAFAGIQATIFGEVEAEHREHVEAAGGTYDPRAALGTNLASALPQAVLELLGPERLMARAVKAGKAAKKAKKAAEVSGKLANAGDKPRWELTKDVLEKGVSGALEESFTEVVQGTINDVVALRTYDDSREVWTGEGFQRRVLEGALGFGLGAVGGGVVGTASAVDERAGVRRLAKKLVEVQPKQSGGPMQSVAVDPETGERQVYVTDTDGGLLTPLAYELLRKHNTDEDLMKLSASPEQGQLLIAAANGDKQAQAAYNKQVRERVFLGLEGPISNRWKLSLAGANGREVLIEELSEDGEGTVGVPIRLDLSQHEDLRAFMQIQQARGIANTDAAIKEAQGRKQAREEQERSEERLKAVEDMIGFLKARAVTRPTEQTGESVTLADDVKAGRVSLEHVHEAVRIAIELGHLPAGATPATVSVRGQSMQVKSGPLAVYEFINRLYEGADPLTVLEESAETYIKLSLSRGELELSDIARWRSELEGKAGKWSRPELIEWFSGQAQAYFVGKADQSWHVPIPPSVRAWLERMRAYLGELFKAARHLMRLEAEGKLDSGFKIALAEAVGLDGATVAALRSSEELRAIARGEASGIGDYAGVFLSQTRYGPKRDQGADSQTTYQLRAFHERRYAQAKANGQTDLTAQQWQQVHSPEFKAWFGDWQRLRAEQRIDAMEPVEVQLDEKYRDASVEELREAVVTHLRDLAKAGVKAVHPELGEVGFASSRIGKVINTSAASEKLHTVLDIVRVLEAAHLIESADSYKPKEVKEGTLYHSLAAKVNGFGREFIAVLTVKELKDGLRFYNTIAVESVDEEASWTSPRASESSDSDSTSALHEAGRSKLSKLDRVNPEEISKAINPRTGEPLVVYHGTQRPDRVGTVFDPERATSGPMAFFTDNPQVASGYAVTKKDTSLGFAPEYAEQFRFRVGKGEQTVSIVEAWKHLSAREKQRITKAIYTVGYQDADNMEGPIVANSESIADRQHFDMVLREKNGNALEALVEVWLQDGTLFNEEAKFLEVLSAAGVDKSRVFWEDPDAEHSAVYPVYLSIQNPFDTGKVWPEIVTALERAARAAPMAADWRDSVDLWAKDSVSATRWLELLRDDIEKGTTYTWTRIPDWVSDALRELGFDGIKDTGGKNGGDGHTVWIPFRSEQVKSATANRGAFDASNPDITYQLRGVDNTRREGLAEGMPEEPLSPEERAELLEHQRFLLGEPVAQLTGEEFAEGQEGKLRFRIADWYKKQQDAVVDVEGVGSIKLDSRAIEQSLRHGGKGRPKVAAFAAVPSVLRKGRIIHREPLHGTKDGDFVHIAAPVQIGSQSYVADVVVKADRNSSRMYLHDVVLKEALRLSAYASEEPSRGGDATKAAEQQSASADAGVVETVLRRIFSVKADAPSPTYQLRPLGGGEEKAAKKTQVFEASGVPQTLLQEIDARLERIRARQIGQEELSRAAQPVAVATREAGLLTRGVRAALDRWAEPIARRMEKLNPVLGQNLRRLEFDMGRGRVAAWEKVKPFADGLAQLAKAAPQDYAALDLALKNGERGIRDRLLIKHGLADAWGPVEFLLRTYHAKLGQAGFEVGFLENYFPRKVVDSDGLLDFYVGDEAAVAAINERMAQLEEQTGQKPRQLAAQRLFSGIPQNLKERSIWRVTPKTVRFYASPVEALQTYIEQVNEALSLKAFFGEAAVFTGKVKSGEKADSAQLGELFGMDIGKSIAKYAERLVERGVLSREQGLEVSQMLRARFNKTASWKWLQGAKNITLLTTLGHYTTTLTQVGDLAFALYEAGVYHTLAEAKAALKSESKVTKEAVGIDAIAEGFKDPSKLSKAVDWVFKRIGFEHMDRVGKEAIMNAKLAQLQEEALRGELNEKALAMLEASFERSAHAKIIDDLRAGRQTPDTLFLAYSTLANFQPISLSEYPQVYLNNPNGRIFYLLKSFTLKALSAMRREGISKIVHGKTIEEKAEGFYNLTVLAGLMYLLGVPIDALKDFLMGRDPRLEDLHVDNMLKLVGVNRWAVWRLRDGHVFQAAWAVLGPPKPWIDYPWSDWEKIAKEQRKGLDADLSKLESWKLIPIVGRPYYWHFGGGADKVKRRRENQSGR